MARHVYRRRHSSSGPWSGQNTCFRTSYQGTPRRCRPCLPSCLRRSAAGCSGSVPGAAVYRARAPGAGRAAGAAAPPVPPATVSPYSSALARSSPLSSYCPPATSTIPLSNNVAVCFSLATVMLPVAANVRAVGSYSSALERKRCCHQSSAGDEYLPVEQQGRGGLLPSRGHAAGGGESSQGWVV